MLSGVRSWSRGLVLGWVALSIFLTAEAASWGRLGSIASFIKPPQRQAPKLLEGYVKFDENNGVFSFVRGLQGLPRDDSPAHGSFSDALRHKSNFGQLRITTNPAFPDDVQMQAAGFVEGYLTAERIFDYAYNMKSWLASQTNDTFKVGDWLFEQDRWARQQVRDFASGQGDAAAGAPSPLYWRAVGLLIAQMDGLMAGYSARLSEMGPEAPLERLTKWDFLVLNALGDMEDLMAIIFPDTDDGSDTSDYDDIENNDSSNTNSDQVDQVESVRNPTIAGLTSDTFTTTTDMNVKGLKAGKPKARSVRTPNPERDSSFFFRLEEEEEEEATADAPREQQRKEEQRPRHVARALMAGEKQQQPEMGKMGAGLREGEDAEDEGLPIAAPRGSWEGLTPGQVRARIAMRGRCTALVKVTPGLDDLLMGHVTWWSYASMLRIYKHYNLRLNQLTGVGGQPANTRISFSSYPGQISSADDWYLLGSGLVVTETSLDTFDHNRFNATYGCTTQSLLSWQRVLAANLLAVDGPGWAELAAAYNGGTYNNQYMIVNLNLFSPGSELQPGLLTVTEIIPGLIVSADATSDLLLGHFPSYNVPYFPEVYEAAGYRRHAEAMAARGQEFAEAARGISYQLAPRAKIFRRDAASAAELDSFRRLLRSNGWDRRPDTSDPLSASSPWDALCARGDLDPESPALYGCYDGKVTNFRRALELSADAINGPTTENGQEAFRWDVHGHIPSTKYRGMLEVYETEWEEQRP
ncbi:hypothetical protein Vretimale_14663 [Volvox reticuliferus]|uniref:Phospholipase B-like n=1 Tax=Volvox reticuliferus TaxID=1737510 RepID=A0A8J4CSE6_9CHLO|nr:hypothetical protein Vretifemale_15675 [Volvox reticuliferus]GIM11147.1 hypothetical protein Vretimale_14663 [Volvox reticuliferus]